MRRTAALCALLLAGCVSARIADLTLVSNQSVGRLPDPVARNVEGEDCKVNWTGSLFPSLDEAIDRAHARVPEGNALASVTVYFKRTSFILFVQNCYRVKGDVVHIAVD